MWIRNVIGTSLVWHVLRGRVLKFVDNPNRVVLDSENC